MSAHDAISDGATQVQYAKDGTAEHVEAADDQPKGRDKAAQLLKLAGRDIVVSPEDNKRILRKIDLAILPIILFIYCLQSLDKTALSYASVFDLLDATHLVGSQYSWLGSIVYVAQLVWQPLVAFALVKLPLGKFCAIMVFCWGATLCGMVAAKDFGGLMATRFILGSFEASVAPTFIAIVQIIFLFCGLLTVCFSVVVFLFLPDSPMGARFLSPGDKLIAIERLRMNQMGISSGTWKWQHVRECLLDIKTWIWFSLLTAVSIPSGGITNFGPLIVKSFGFDSFTTILFNMPFGAVQLIATLGSAFISTHYQAKGPLIAALCIPPIIGLSILLNLDYTVQNRGVLLFAYYITSVYPAITPLIYSWSGQNTGGDTKRKMTTAVLFIGASVGNIIGPLLYTTDEAKHYYRGPRSNLALFATIIVLVGIGTLYIAFLNKRHARARERLGKAGKIVDLSMAHGRQLAGGQTVNDTDAAGGAGVKAFDDITDLQNEDFIYVY
ncbi:hypothetical protein AMS68_006192 [Peltaster fructicola]|uniref:Major facilitator superfamily (MFS) profile domain-containing protein n=1 Tax=Peltaster fructicola TaxID=286661 RepID=A0A6H0Y192_9PEZI|nr:hypothetical protein AMS68_006192 [Peltaster fructicola]